MDTTLHVLVNITEQLIVIITWCIRSNMTDSTPILATHNILLSFKMVTSALMGARVARGRVEESWTEKVASGRTVPSLLINTVMYWVGEVGENSRLLPLMGTYRPTVLAVQR